MGKYRVFASVYPDEKTMREHQPSDHALELKRTSGVFTIEANSLGDAVKKFQQSEDFERFFAENGKARFFYLDEEHNIHRA